MNIVIVNNSSIPVFKYGGTERVIWDLGKSLSNMGHQVIFLVNKDSYCPFAKVLYLQNNIPLKDQIPTNTDIIHFHFQPNQEIKTPYIVTLHGNYWEPNELDANTVFVSKNHAARFGSDQYVYNGLDWNQYSKPNLKHPRKIFHFLGNASWKVKNLKGALQIIKKIPQEQLYVLGGSRINIKMGFRITLSSQAIFKGMVDNYEKSEYLNQSKGLLFPVRWHEPFGLAIIESLYFGCPIFGTPYGSLPELIGSEFGYLSHQSHQIAEVMRKHSFNQHHCHEYALDEFNAHKMTLEYLKKYEMALNHYPINKQAPKLVQIPTEKYLPFE